MTSSSSLTHVTLGYLTTCAWLTLVVLSVAPSGTWPQMGLRGNVERAMLFFVVVAITRATITEHQTRLQIAAFAVMAILFEVARAWVAAQSNGLAGWVFSMAGVIPSPRDWTGVAPAPENPEPIKRIWYDCRGCPLPADRACLLVALGLVTDAGAWNMILTDRQIRQALTPLGLTSPIQRW